MSQLFHRNANPLAKAVLIALVVFIIALIWILYAFFRSPYVTAEGRVVDQPVPFSHAHHVGHIGIDCRYCHSSVEQSAFAGMPSTETCMNCHAQIWSTAPMLEPVRESYRTGTPLQWVRVNDLPDFAYFNHSIHVERGIDCATCHGNVAEMPLMRKGASLQMQWCLDCHRQANAYLKPDYIKAAAAEKNQNDLTDCSVCHR